MPGTTGSAGTVGASSPANKPSTLAAVGAGGLGMFLFALGWNKVGGNIARAKMRNADPADKKILSRSKWNGAYAGLLLGGGFLLTAEEYKPWVLVVGAPIASYFLPGLLRQEWVPFLGKPKKRRIEKQQRRRQKRRKKGGQRQRGQSMRSRPDDLEAFDVEDFDPSRRSPRAFRR